MCIINEKGNALLLTVLTIVFISVIGVSLLKVTANSNKTTVNERFDQSTYYIAEAGLNLEKSLLYSAISTAYSATVNDLNNTKAEEVDAFNFTSTFDTYFCSAKPEYCIPTEKQYAHFQKQYDKQPISKTAVSKNCTATKEMNCTFTIQSRGYFDDQPSKSRELEQSIKVTSIGYTNTGGDLGQTPGGTPSIPPIGTLPFSNLVALSHGKITTSGNADVYGNIASISNNYEVKKDHKLHGELFTVPLNNNIDLSSYLPPFHTTDFSKLTLSTSLQQLQYSDVYVTTLSGKTTINIGTNNRTIYVDNLDIKDGINVMGSGTLTIIVRNEINLEGTISRSDKNPNNLNIYYQGDKTVTTSTKDNGSHMPTNIDGSIHVLKSEIDFNGGKILGNIYYHGTKEMKINGNSKGNANYIVAPNAPIKTNGDADFYGSILAKEIKINGNHDLYFSSDMLVPLPNPNPIPTTPSTPPIMLDGNPIIKESDVEEK